MFPERIAQYRIIGRIGEGGMGIVYRAEDQALHRQVAIKLICAEAVRDLKARKRFAREVEITSSLSHPNICTVYECGVWNGSPYMVMELLEGRTLRDMLDCRALPLPRLLELGISVADALNEAHEHGIVHRDVNSANIFITSGGVAKVLDFGLAKICSQEPLGPGVLIRKPSTVSTPGFTIGTTSNMSPEQVTGQELDRRSDVFALGILLYEMATGMLPFDGSTGLMVMHAILYKSPEPASKRNPEIPLEFDRILKKALEKDRAQRYRTAGDLAADLARLSLDLAPRGSEAAASAPFPDHSLIAIF